MDIISAYAQVGTYRGAAALVGTTHKTVRRVIERTRTAESLAVVRAGGPKNFEVAREVVAAKMASTDGRVSAKRLLPAARTAGYEGSDRNFRRLVAEERARWRAKRRVFRPWVPVPGEHVAIDWGEVGRLKIFCAVFVWSRWRFVRFATDMKADTTLRLLGECFEAAGGVPAVVLADRMGCLKGGVVANVVVPTGDYVRFASHFGFRPDFCEAADPESKGVVEALVGYAKADLVIPGGWDTLADANAAAVAWCVEVNGRVHTEIAAVPDVRLGLERPVLRALPSLRPPLRSGEFRKVDKLSCVRFGSARYSVPRELVGASVEISAADGEVTVAHAGGVVARHGLVGPGEVSIIDEHYGGPRRSPARAIRARSGPEKAFLALGAPAEDFLRAAAAAGTNRLGGELAQIVALEAAWGRDQLITAVARAGSFRRFRAADVTAILEAGAGVTVQVPAGELLDLGLPEASIRPLSAYSLEALA
jgi:Integrase core domain